MKKEFYDSVKKELVGNILPYWEKYSRDTVNEGFFGDIDNDNRQDGDVSRSIVMTSRFLWAYSSAARLLGDSSLLGMADFAYKVIKEKYIDRVNGGVYWSVRPDGTPDVRKKQIYGEAFCCYGLSEYAAAVREFRGADSCAQEAMDSALAIFEFLEKYALDPADGGYVEARAENWAVTDDMLLSKKDMNCPKSMNTNLHVMEAYTNLHRTLPVVCPERMEERKSVGKSLAALIIVTVEKILQKNGHLGMFFNMKWNLLDDEISYGHDIEASWLLWEAAVELGDEPLKERIRPTVLYMVDVALAEGTDSGSGAMENFTKGGKRDRTRIWWNQAEALNGFYNAWLMTGLKKYADACELQWKWIEEHQVDRKGGEWWAAVSPDGKPDLQEPKGGNWKTAYHSARACIVTLESVRDEAK